MEAGGHEHDDHHHNEKVEVGGVSAVEMMINSTSQTPLPLQLTSTTHQLLAPPCPPPTPPPEHLCYVRCNFCSTVLAVVIPCKRLLDTVTVKCGHCSNLSFLSTRPPPPPPLAPPPPLTLPLTLPSANINSSSSAHHPGIYQSQQQQQRLDHPQLSLQGYNFMEKAGGFFNEQKRGQSSKSSSSSSTEQLSPPASFVVKPPEKKHRLPSAYNRFMKEEIQRIKAANPEIPHREAFSAAAKNWARYIPNPAGSVSDTNKRSLN